MDQQRTLWHLVALRAEQSPDRIFLRDESGQTITYGEYRSMAEGVAGALQVRGVGATSTVAWQLPNWQEALVLTAALSCLGATQVPLLPMLRDSTVGFVCRQVKADLLITPGIWKDFDYAAMAARIAREQGGLATLAIDSTASGGAGLPVADGVKTPPDGETVGTPRVAWVFYTSGTTADPKGALHTDDSLIATGSGMVGVLELAGDDVVPLVFPFTHIGGISWLVAFLLSGCECLLVETFSADVIPYLRQHGVTVAGAGVVFAQTYLKAQRAQPDSPIMPRLRFVTGGGSTKPSRLHQEVKDTLDCGGFISGYGMTECPIAVMNTVRDPDDRLANTEGRPLPGMQVRIKDPKGRVLAAGEEGVIWLKGPHQCQGYIDSALNRDVFDQDGFFSSGDIGALDAEGWLSVTGRVKDIIIRKGENISAIKVEDCLYRHPGVTEIAVIALPDEERGEMVCAVVEPSQPDLKLTLEELTGFGLASGLLKQELPERLELVTALPRNPSGKVLKDALKRRYTNSHPV